MSESCFVRVVILNYNESQLTLDLIDQLKNQSHRNFEIVVVDNASRQQEVELLKQHLPTHVKTIYSESNLGYSGGNNLGLTLIEDRNIDFFLVLNNDLIIQDRDFIATMVKGMFQNEKIVASSPIVDTISSGIHIKDQIQVRRVLNKWQTYFINIPIFKIFTKKLGHSFLYRNEMPFLNKFLLCDSINGAAFLIETKFLKSIGFLDEGTFLYYEEIILGKQIINKNKICLLNGFTSVQHLQGISTKSSRKKINTTMERYKYKSSLYYLKKYEKLDGFSSIIYIFLQELSIGVKKALSVISNSK